MRVREALRSTPARRACAAVVALLALAPSACGPVDPTSTSATTSAVRGGAADAEHPAVLAVGHQVGNGMLCTGTMLTSDLVVTAWHCVADMTGVPSMPDCSEASPTQKPPAHPSAELFVVDATDVFASAARPLDVAEILTPPGITRFCGADVAVLRLAAPLAGHAVAAPRLDAPPVAGEPVSVVGYGQTTPLDDATTGVRTFAASTVEQVGAQTGSMARSAEELSVAQGPCAGDSGGPAFDADGRTIGVMSRGSQSTCKHMIYERIDAHAEWLRALARDSAARTGEPVAGWAAPPPEPVVTTTTAAESGCALGATGGPRSAGASATLSAFAALSALAAIVGASACRRRR